MNVKDKILINFEKMFGFKIETNKKVGTTSSNKIDTVKPIDVKTNADGKKYLDVHPFPEEVKALLNYWIGDCHTSKDAWKNRQQMYQDMDAVYYNCQIITRAIELLIDEVIQADSNEQFVFIEAKPKLKKFILDFFDNTGILEHIRSTLRDIILYGNAYYLNVLGSSGIDEVILVNPYDIKDRLEFTPAEVENKLKKDQNFIQLTSYDRINQLVKSITDKHDHVTNFKSYLLGFQVGNYIVPPWRVVHFRNSTTLSPFKPFGVPLFIHAVSAYRQYDSAMTLQVLARGAKFPKNVYKLNLPNIIDPTEKLNAAIEFMRELTNSGIGGTKKEDIGVNETVVTIEGLYTFEQETPDIDLGKMDDLQLLRDDLIIASYIPRNLIDPNDSGFGDSGISLIEKFKPFARLVYRIQNIYLQGLSQLIKIHAIQSNKFALEDIDFILNMPYPESQTNNELISSQTALLDLANNIISTIEDKILGGEKLPSELMKTIYMKFLPYDDAIVSRWIDQALDKKQDNANKDELDKTKKIVGDLKSKFTKQNYDNYSNNLESYVDENKNWKLLEKTMGKENLKETINEIILENKQGTLREGTLKGKHFYSSKNLNTDFPAEKLREFDKERIRKLTEQMSDSELYKYNKEEVEYKFGDKESKDIKNEEKEIQKLEENIKNMQEGSMING